MDKSLSIFSSIIVYMKYAKYLPELKRRETFDEIVDRNVKMHQKKYPNLAKEIYDVYNNFVKTKKVLPSMRSMQFAGKPIDVNPTRIFNCAYTPVDDWRVFSEIIFLLLGGTGVGFSVQKHHVEKLPEINKPNPKRNKRYLVGDSIEGWADAVKILMKSYFYGTSTINFDFSDIRPKGSLLITSGGKAPGPEPLKLCLVKIQGILENKNEGEQLTTIEVHDIICHLADAVLAGGIRRAALISLFSADDEEMLAAKTGAWWELNPQRGRANNSAVLVRSRIEEEFFLQLWKRVEDSKAGEPGLLLTNDKDLGTNPCVSGNSLITVCDHTINERNVGVPYKIPMKLLVEIVNSSELPPNVLSYNEETGKREWKKITAAQLTKEDTRVLEIEYNGKKLICTSDHKIYTKNRGWVRADELIETDELLDE